MCQDLCESAGEDDEHGDEDACDNDINNYGPDRHLSVNVAQNVHLPWHGIFTSYHLPYMLFFFLHTVIFAICCHHWRQRRWWCPWWPGGIINAVVTIRSSSGAGCIRSVQLNLRTPLIYLFVLEGGFEIETGIRYLNLYMLI